MNYTDTDLLLQARAGLLQRAACDGLVRRSVIHGLFDVPPASPDDDGILVLPVHHELLCVSSETGIRVSFPDDAPREEVSAVLLRIVAALDTDQQPAPLPPDLDTENDLTETPSESEN